MFPRMHWLYLYARVYANAIAEELDWFPACLPSFALASFSQYLSLVPVTLFRFPLLLHRPEVRQFFNREINGCAERASVPPCNQNLNRNEFVERNKADALWFCRCSGPCIVQICLWYTRGIQEAYIDYAVVICHHIFSYPRKQGDWRNKGKYLVPDLYYENSLQPIFKLRKDVEIQRSLTSAIPKLPCRERHLRVADYWLTWSTGTSLLSVVEQ